MVSMLEGPSCREVHISQRARRKELPINCDRTGEMNDVQIRVCNEQPLSRRSLPEILWTICDRNMQTLYCFNSYLLNATKMSLVY